MKKAEALKIATYLRTTYQTLKGCVEGRDERYKGVKYIPINLPFAPTEENVKGLSDFILENEDRNLYEKTFGLIDLELIKQATLKLSEIWDGWSEDIINNLLLENYLYIRENYKDSCGNIFGISETRALLKAIWGEVMILQPIFKNLIPTQEASPTPHPDTLKAPITDLVIEPSTGSTAPEEWRLPSELDTPEAREIWERAKKMKLVTDDFKWLNGLQLLSCFAREMSLRFHLGKGINADGTERINWKVFEKMFKIERGKLRSNYNDIQKIGTEPRGIDIVNKIFEL